jgi:hypothetical protein
MAYDNTSLAHPDSLSVRDAETGTLWFHLYDAGHYVGFPKLVQGWEDLPEDQIDDVRFPDFGAYHRADDEHLRQIYVTEAGLWALAKRNCTNHYESLSARVAKLVTSAAPQYTGHSNGGGFACSWSPCVTHTHVSVRWVNDVWFYRLGQVADQLPDDMRINQGDISFGDGVLLLCNMDSKEARECADDVEGFWGQYFVTEDALVELYADYATEAEEGARLVRLAIHGNESLPQGPRKLGALQAVKNDDCTACQASTSSMRLDDLISHTFASYAGGVGFSREDWPEHGKFLDEVVDEVIEAADRHGIKDVFRQALGRVIEDVLDREHRAAEAIVRECELHATGQYHKSAWPNGAFPGLPDE